MPVMTRSLSFPFTALTVALLLATAGCSKPEPAPAEPQPTIAGEVITFPNNQDPATLRTAAVRAPADTPVQLPGRLAWDEDRTSRVYAPYAGRIERLLATVGQAVAKGQPLAQISSADIGQAQADLHKAEADQALGRAASARARELTEAGIIARKDLEQAEADLARSTAEGQRARARLAQYGVAGTAVNQSLTLTAPLAGIVVDRSSNAGAEVRTDVQGAALFTISDPTSLWASIDLDETQLSLLKPGQTVVLTAAGWPDQQFSATVLSVGESVDPASRTVKVRARVANPERKLKAEMFVNAQVQATGGLPLVPADAVFLRGEQSLVFVQKGNGRFERRAVTVRPAGPQQSQVVAGLAVGDKVVVGGALYLSQLLDAAK
jgi:cobalt-zinc-cadmium efflux system membrane fusion protein